jgi:sialic acid synthase SpsE
MGRVFVIAEAGSNWRLGTPDRDLEMATRLIDAAALAGADAVKFQTYRAHSVYVPNAGTSRYLASMGVSRPINEIFEDLEMPYELIPRIAEHCERVGIEFLSTPFSVEDARAVDPYVRRHKVASYEINHVRLVQWLAATGKPLIMSTGAATDEDIEFGLGIARSAGATAITLLQCTARYPAPPDALNLLAIPYLRRTYGVDVGLSDHSADPVVAPVAAVALGATIIEKHFTIDRRLPGPDHPFALEPDELAEMVRAIRLAECMLGSEAKVVDPSEEELRSFAVRAIQATRPISPGELLVEGVNFDVLRPGDHTRGLHPKYLEQLRDRVAARSIAAGDGITAADVHPPLTPLEPHLPAAY